MMALVYIYFISIAILAVYGFHRSTMLLRLYLKPYKQPTLPKVEEFPSVCVQLPIYNEPKVVERLINSVTAFDYPEDRLEIQILDDSTDETSLIIDRIIKKLDKQNIQVLRRHQRKGFKAGALAEGLAKTKAEFIAVFDADFIPDSDFLLKTVPYFQNSKIAFVQARWTFVNKTKNLLTRAQSILIDAHFIIEHPLRYMSAFFNFNGTAGLWRKSAILSAGGWQGDTITEDLDLSYRALLKGWKAIYLKNVTCKSELPETIDAFKSQQYRWMKGSAQVFKKLIWKIIKSDLPVVYKIEAFFHLSANFCYQLMLICGILLVPVSAYRSMIYFSVGLWFELFIFFFTFVSLYVFYATSQKLQNRRIKIKEVLLAISLGTGIAAHCAVASFAGLFASVGEFVRTPKLGSFDGQAISKGKCLPWSEAFKNAMQHRKEVLIFSYLSLCLIYLLYFNFLFTLPFLLLILSGYFIVLYSALCPVDYEA